MRHIHLDDGLRLRFPARSEDFDQGVEIGMVAVLMDQGMREFSRWISRGNLGQIEAIAKVAAKGFEQRRDMLIQHGATERKDKDGELRVMSRSPRA